MIHKLPWTRRALSAALFVGAGLAAASGADAQAFQGRVLKADAAVAGVEVELHRVTREGGGVLERTTTDGSGAFRIDLPPTDTASGFTVYFATADYLGVRYFGPPLHPGEARDAYSIAVFDTVAAASAPVPIRIIHRDMVLLPEQLGGWEVNEILQIVNPGAVTLVAPTGMPTWEFKIPEEAFAFEVGEGGSESTGIVRMGERVIISEPLVPGVREVFIRYRVPGSLSEFAIPVTASTSTFNLLIAQPAPDVVATGFGDPEPFEADGRAFAAYRAAGLEPGAALGLAWEPTGPPVDPRMAALAVAAILLLVGAGAALRRRGPGAGETRRAAPPAPVAVDGAQTPSEPRELVS